MAPGLVLKKDNQKILTDGKKETFLINEQETGSTKYKNIGEPCQMARGQWLQATSRKLQAPSIKLDKIEL